MTLTFAVIFGFKTFEYDFLYHLLIRDNERLGH